ncbi:Methenyltetrahydromethanopterin cyclohydrolase [bacterium HR40]|nr:Methenyltetrahydromethanopterin cyclohydrolase [bacterium HR40]
MTAPAGHWPSVGARAVPLLERLVADAEALRLRLYRSPTGALVVDAGIEARGGLEAGRRIAELCMGGLGVVRFAPGSPATLSPFSVCVHASEPVSACLLAQYAGWSLSHGRWFAMASGPGRALAAREPLFAELGYRDHATRGIFVLETDRPPPDPLVAEVAAACGLPPEALAFVLTPTTSLAGSVQIVARVLEVALHKVHELGFPLARIVDGIGRAPLPPPSPDFLEAMGRTNDAILFGGTVQLFVAGPEEEALALADRLPSSASPDYGRPFRELFEAAGRDFYRIDRMLFSPAEVVVTSLESGRSRRAGGVDPELLARSFGG